MEAELRTHLIALATRYATARKIELVTVARLATGDWRFFERIEAGASFTARKYDGIVAWFAANWPDDTEWPDEITRPDASRSQPSQDAAA